MFLTSFRDAFLAAHPKCIYCGDQATSIDHIVPVDKGGGDELSNLAPSCGTCNSIAGSKLFPSLVDKKRHVRRKLMAYMIVREVGENATAIYSAVNRLSRIADKHVDEDSFIERVRKEIQCTSECK